MSIGNTFNPDQSQVMVVPGSTPMFENSPSNAGKTFDWALNRTWWMFFEALRRKAAASGAGGPYIRTLLLKDTTVLNNVADHVPIFVAGTAMRVIGVLRTSILADLTVRINIEPGHIPLATITIPSGTGIDNPVTAEAFTTPDVAKLGDLAVLSFDVTASDGSADPKGVASFTLQWA